MADLIIKPSSSNDSLKFQGSDDSAQFTIAGTTGSLGSGIGYPAGHILQVLQTFKKDDHPLGGTAEASATGKNAFAFIPGQGTDPVFQKGITVSGSNNKVLITHHGSYGASGALYKLLICLFRGPASDTVIGSCTKLGAGEVSSNGNQSQSILSLTMDTASTETQGSFSFLDTPGAGTHYYKLGWLGEVNSTFYINRNHNDGNVAYHARTSSTLTLMEIQG